MREILIGTHNRHKTEEISRLLAGLGIAARDLNEFPHIPPVEEDGKTLLENSRKKANTYGGLTKLACLADDTGLEVEALGGAPGVYSARYAGEHCSYLDNCGKLIKELGPSVKRTAVFKTVISLYDPQTGQIQSVEGALEGEITREPRGANGFGYDPIFLVKDTGRTLAEMSLEEKNMISHRARAVQKMLEIIRKHA
ncbi:MAG: non-canonical purine NTP pyrophosphatase, RdgB/HAM1 family [Elusimicrobia bacterium RIFCSPLOWO2_01_FULL_54_10]|nr:MAG: non-canonical purine NTP pyrophosphatase, RdgB/HAM1 family [Elusimicrobia bacterium RIFCSPLOWO2_01_FULL_54_10]